MSLTSSIDCVSEKEFFFCQFWFSGTLALIRRGWIFFSNKNVWSCLSSYYRYHYTILSNMLWHQSKHQNSINILHVLKYLRDCPIFCRDLQIGTMFGFGWVGTKLSLFGYGLEFTILKMFAGRHFVSTWSKYLLLRNDPSNKTTVRKCF